MWIDAQLKYGIKIPCEYGDALFDKLNTDGRFNGMCLNDFIEEYSSNNHNDLITLYRPLESDHIMIISKKAPAFMAEVKEVILIGANDLRIDESWKNDIIQFCQENDVEYEPSEIGWNLFCDCD
jgi:hypothetical protein